MLNFWLCRRAGDAFGVNLPSTYLQSHGITADDKCSLSEKQMRNMRLEVVATNKPGRFALTLFILGARLKETEEVDLASLLRMQVEELTAGLSLFAEQLSLNLRPFVIMLFKKFYNRDNAASGNTANKLVVGSHLPSFSRTTSDK